MSKPVCVIVGAGPGNGAALAHKFNNQGFRIALLARSQDFISELADTLSDARAYVCDVSDETRMREVFAQIQAEQGAVHSLIFNAGTRDFRTIEDTDSACFEDAWKINTLGCFLAAKQVIPAMKAAAQGNIVIIGATASWKGTAGFTAFAASKAGQRSLAQSMAKHLGPMGIHVAYLIVDGIIDSPRARDMFPHLPDNGFIHPGDLAQVVWDVTQQAPSTWTFELDIRPFCETW
jgi:NAD(P)-dependent dehydrogenase (short-subunit alcohol dehydrogenase family)